MTITLQDLYYIVSIVIVLCGASYRLGYTIGRNKRK